MKLFKLTYFTFWACSVNKETVLEMNRRILSESVRSLNLLVVPPIFKCAVLRSCSQNMERPSDEKYK